MDEAQYLRRYPHTKRVCVICKTKYSYKFRGRKRDGKTCKTECAQEHERNTRYRYTAEWYVKKKEKGKRSQILDYFINNLEKADFSKVESLYIQLQSHLVNKQWMEQLE